MTASELTELFIAAAEIDRRLPIYVKPAEMKSLSLPFVHLFEDRRGWEPADMINGEVMTDEEGNEIDFETRLRLKAMFKDKLKVGDKGRRDLETEMLQRSDKISPEDVTLWEKANELICLVDNVDQRRALLHWAIAMAGGKSFAKWCRENKILRETGRWRKEKALKAISLALSCVEGVSKREIPQLGDLPNRAEKDDIPVNIGKSRSWMAEGSRPLVCDFDFELQEFEWANEQNARRRAREKRKAA